MGFNLSIEQIAHQLSLSRSATLANVYETLRKSHFTPLDLPVLLSPAAEQALEIMAKKAQQITRQRFGRVMQLFIPLYLSNECFNTCTYCGFSMEHKYKRKILSDEEIIREASFLKRKGFDHVLLLTGESERRVGADYIAHAVQLISNQFASVSIEVQPLSTAEYETIIKAGADGITLFQETYHPETYKAHHLKGMKRNYENRLDALDRAGKAGFYKIQMGALLGLYDWQFESFALSQHLNYMMKTHWRSKYAVSFNRIKSMIGDFSVPHVISDKTIVQLITAFRLVYPDLGISLSTREPSWLRDRLFQLGITQISAESDTSPGGYSGCDEENQFDISDNRSLKEILQVLKDQGFDPVFRDWHTDMLEKVKA